MKQTVMLAVILVTMVGFSNAQEAELKAAQTNVAAKHYLKALEDISKAKKKIAKVVSDNLLSVLPKEFGDFRMQERQDEPGDRGGGISATRSYAIPVVEKEQSEESPENPMEESDEPRESNMHGGQNALIYAEITTNMMSASSVANAHSMSDEGHGQEHLKPIRVKGYRAIIMTQNNGDSPEALRNNQETVQIIVGGSFITINARGLGENGQALKFAEEIDFDKLKAMIGE